MRIVCSVCSENARINKSNRISTTYATLYCTCANSECGHRFVMDLSFSHSLQPSKKNQEDVALFLLDTLGKDKIKEIVALM